LGEELYLAGVYAIHFVGVQYYIPSLVGNLLHNQHESFSFRYIFASIDTFINILRKSETNNEIQKNQNILLLMPDKIVLLELIFSQPQAALKFPLQIPLPVNTGCFQLAPTKD